MNVEPGLALPMGFVLSVAFVFGLLVGSFLNVVIHRLPLGQSVVSPRSRCPGCETQISALDNIPVLSFLWLRGRCRHCAASISWRYPAVEALTGALFVVIAYRFGLSIHTPIWMFFAAALVVAAMIDIDHEIIPDEISLGGLAAGCVIVPLAWMYMGATWQAALLHSFGGALIGGGLLWLVGFVHARICVALDREFDHWPGEGEEVPTPGSLDYWTWFPGLGFGDVKLLAMIGAFLGPQNVIVTVLMASLAGLALGVAWGIATRSFSSPFGFAPAIAAGALIALLVPISLI